jgi:hypothetical protein
VGLDELASDDPDTPFEFVDSPALPTEARTQSAAGASASSDVMLTAIAQLLVEKGVFTRDELVEQLQALSKISDGA